MSAIFQRPLCEMGRAYDFAYRPILGDPGPGTGGPCDDRPTSTVLLAASADPSRPDPPRRSFLLCPEHRDQLARMDLTLRERGIAPRRVP
ncbi:MAG: hypothetical protein QXG65_01495 [Thermoplasmata archaeon]